MGIYDYYENMQMKIGDVQMNTYKVGDSVDISDGVYVGYEGVVVIKDSVFVAFFEEMLDKWGGELDLNAVLQPSNPVSQALDNYKDADESEGEENG